MNERQRTSPVVASTLAVLGIACGVSLWWNFRLAGQVEIAQQGIKATTDALDSTQRLVKVMVEADKARR